MVLKSYLSLTSHWIFIIKSYEKATIFISGVHLSFQGIICDLKKF